MTNVWLDYPAPPAKQASLQLSPTMLKHVLVALILKKHFHVFGQFIKSLQLFEKRKVLSILVRQDNYSKQIHIPGYRGGDESGNLAEYITPHFMPLLQHLQRSSR